ncbi:bluetail domain-containing putative surface protein [Microcystis aeruginosa]|uniref:beta strand repeat-containing protein n=1 Tax=Microcystis aeruginosa TaxID=1126 RepID=UPI00287FF295|nr:bluetail domain-containing putative surface protein [Microcystis aeruginosa]WNF12856.1 bluetail domain-containing putative surface protein [Microcystis aeruginosa NRERC-214]
MTSTLLPILPAVDDVLFYFAQSDDFWANLETAFGASYDVVKATQLRQQWKSRNFSQIPPIEVLSDEVLGTANGAYSSSTNKIYLSASFLNTASSAAIVNVILEEIGHYVDAQINQTDSAGDEGAIFAELVQGNSLDVATLDGLRGENDQTTIIVNGEIIPVEQANFTGTNGNDNITGTSDSDNISGLDGNDTLSGLGGNDYLYGGNGNDSLDGGAGDDALYSDSGSDTINGGTGFDYYRANYSNRTTGLTMTYDPTTGNGTITIGSEVDTLISIESFDGDGGFKGTAFDDVIVGTFANDTNWWNGGLFGGDGNDTISGGAGDDKLFGEEGNDVLNGGSNNDVLYGGNGNDSLNGDTGDDVLYSDAGNDTINGGTGFDYYRANYSNRTTGLTMTYDPTTGNGTITIGSEVDTLISIESFDGDGGFKGTAFDDVIVGTFANDTNWWNGGLFGGDGNDTISGGAGDDKLFGEEGNDVLNGGSNNDVLYGGNGNDSLNGDTGDDVLYSDAGNDTINGGTGFDYYRANYSNRTTGLTMTYDPTTGNGTITIGSEVDTLISIESFDGDGGFKGTAFDDVIVGTFANDTNWWNGGLFGGDGNDTISGGAGDDKLFGEEGNDVLNGGSNNDVLYGGNGNDSLNGDTGDDVLYSDAGNDTINGGTGFDYYRANYSNRTTGLTMTYDPTTGNGTITVGSEVDTLISIESFDGDGGFKGTAFDDVIVGTSANDTNWWNGGLFGGDGNDTISGGAGDDKLFGEDGNDVLNGGANNDGLYGGNGNDTLQGTNNGIGEQDYLQGGTGNDRFILADTTKTFYDDGNSTLPGDNDYATIADFNTTDDIIQLRGSSSNYLLSVDGSNTKLYINKPGSEPDELIAVINNQTALSLTASYFSYVSSPTLPSITLAVSPASVTEDGTTNLVYTFTRSGVTTNPLTVNYTIGGTATLNTDYTRTGTNNTVTFAAGSSTATVTVNPTADTTVESNETVILTLAAGTGYTIGTPNAVTGTINNDDFSQLSINDITVVEGKDNNAILTVTVDNPNPQPITFNYTTAPINATANVDYTSKTGTITIAPNTSTTNITIPILNDNLNEADEAFTVTLSNAVNATINPEGGIGEVIITDTWQSTLTRTLPNNVENLRLIGSNNINGTGNAGNNNITGNSGINQINGGAGIDTLTGGLGADTFIFQFGQSTISTSDLITDFAINSDKIDLLTQAGNATSAPSSFSRAANSTVTTLQNLINQVFTDANGATIGNQGLGVNSAALVQVTTGAIAGTYLVINDSTAGFQSSNDLLINITGFTGTLPALGNIPVGNFFV